MCMYDDSESTTFYAESIRRARKPHKCDECGREIGKGEQYQHVSAKWGGYVQTVKTCSHCQVLQQWLQKECGGFVHHAIVDDAKEHVVEYGVGTYGFGLARLIVSAENRWRRKGGLVAVPAVPRTTFDTNPTPTDDGDA